MPLLTKYKNTNNTTRTVFITAIYSIVSLSMNVQIFGEGYRSFKNKAIQDFIDFRRKVNEVFVLYGRDLEAV